MEYLECSLGAANIPVVCTTNERNLQDPRALLSFGNVARRNRSVGNGVS